MTTLKTIVFPVARIIIWAVIGLALLKLAFFSGATGAPDDGLTPTAQFGQPQWVVGRGDVYNSVQVQASVVKDEASKVVSTVDGYVGFWAVEDGQFVNIGDPIVEMRKEVAGTPGADGSTGATQFTRHTLTAPVAGVVHRSLLLNQTATIGGTVATIDPGTFSISGDLTPQDQYRLLTAPGTAEVTLQGGPATFTCEGVTVGTEVTQSSGDGNDPLGGSTGSGSVKMSCPTPEGTRVFAGLTGTMTVTAGEALGVIVAPVTAVQGSFEIGRVWVVDPASGAQEERDVTLGLSDGQNIEVTSGLEEGETILQYAPGNMQMLPGTDPSMMSGVVMGG